MVEAVSPASTPPYLSSVFFSLYGACLNYSTGDWGAEIHLLERIGVRRIVVKNTAHRTNDSLPGIASYPTQLPWLAQRGDDVLGKLLDAADTRNFSVELGLFEDSGFFHHATPEWIADHGTKNVAVLEELVGLYGNHSSFAGVYDSAEVNDRDWPAGPRYDALVAGYLQPLHGRAHALGLRTSCAPFFFNTTLPKASATFWDALLARVRIDRVYTRRLYSWPMRLVASEMRKASRSLQVPRRRPGDELLDGGGAAALLCRLRPGGQAAQRERVGGRRRPRARRPAAADRPLRAAARGGGAAGRRPLLLRVAAVHEPARRRRAATVRRLRPVLRPAQVGRRREHAGDLCRALGGRPPPEWRRVGGGRAAALYSLGSVSSALTELNLAENKLCGINWQGGTYTAEGINAIVDNLRANSVLTELNLSKNLLCGVTSWGSGTYTAEGINAIADALRVNSVLTSLKYATHSPASLIGRFQDLLV